VEEAGHHPNDVKTTILGVQKKKITILVLPAKYVF
jgi:hypothetical protein